jgi:hypothetical protein
MTASQTLAPIPLVRWDAVVSTIDPTAAPTRSRYRTLKARGLSTEGVHVERRVAGRAAGSSTWHSVLSVIAALTRPTDSAVATQLLVAGAEIERRFVAEIKTYGREAAAGDEFERLLEATNAALADIAGWNSAVFAQAVIQSMDGQIAHLLGRTMSGDDAIVDVPRGLADKWDAASGDGVLVFQRLMESSVIVTILPVARSGSGSEAAFLRSLHPVRTDAEIERLRGLATSGAIGRRVVRRAG